MTPDHAHATATLPATALVRAGLSPTQVARLKGAATRLERYGSTRMSPEGREQTQRKIHAYWQRLGGHPNTLKTACKRGHPLSSVNVYRRTDGSRACKSCMALRKGRRPAWVADSTGRISIQAHDAFYLIRAHALRQQMIEAHPDKGGTSRRFASARDAYVAFVQVEQPAWYAQYGLLPPRRKTTRACRSSSQRRHASSRVVVQAAA